MRRGREFYSRNYERVMDLHSQGLSVREIAEKTGMSYSAVYHWIKGLRKPEPGNVSSFIDLLKKQGPTPVVDIKNEFPKHNELFLTASRRGLPVRRYMMKKRYGDYSTWYYLDGQERLLESRLNELIDKIREIQEKLGSSFK